MKSIRQRTWLIALLVILALFAGCKGESPTAPPTGGGGTPPGSGGGGGQIPPTGATLTLTVSNPNPVIDSTSTITATVTVDGQPAPNGTAVEFTTTNGTFTNVSPVSASIIRTTTNGVATAVLTSSTVGTATVTAVVNNVVRTTTITFVDRPVVTPPPDTTPTITAITPNFGLPGGGQTIRITGTNFRAPVRVLFNTGAGTTPLEAFVVSVTPTEIVAVTPPVNLGAGQQLAAQVVVIVDAGTSAEQRITAASPFTYQNQTLTPVVSTVSPNTGPVTGGTRITIFGEGFQAPLLVQLGDIPSNTWTNAQIINVTYNQIIAVTPPGRDLAPAGNAPVTGPVDLRIVNINSNLNVEVDNAFRFTPAMQITATGPGEGPFTGGTDVTIDGIGFDDPVAVTVAGFAAQVIRVSGTQLLVRTPRIPVAACADVSGTIAVTNVDTGVSTTGGSFTYRVPRPIIVSVSGQPFLAGGNGTITVLNAAGFPRITIGNIPATIGATTPNPDGTTSFTIQIPSQLQLQTRTCPSGGTAPIATAFDINFSSAETGCTAQLQNGLLVLPPQLGSIFLTPNPLNITARAGVPDNPATPLPADESAPPQPGNGVFTIVNNGAAALTITSIGPPTNPNFTITSAPAPGTVLQICDAAVVSVRYTPPGLPLGTPGFSEAAQIPITATTGVAATPVTATETVIGTAQ